MKKILLLALPCLALIQPATAQLGEWREVSRDARGGIYFMRGRDLTNDTDWNPEIWVQGYHEADKSVLYRSSMTHYAIDCNNWTYAIIEGIYYHADGRVRSRKAGSRYNVRPIAAETVIDTIAGIACP